MGNELPTDAMLVGVEDMGYLMIALFAVAITEIVVTGTWQGFYFRLGIPLFRKKLDLPEAPELSTDLLCQRFCKGVTTPLVFRRISPNEIAFRESIVSCRLNYTPVMHGLIRYDEVVKVLYVVGWANWYAPMFLVFFAGIAFSMSPGELGFGIMMILGALCVLAVLYAIQYSRFDDVYEMIVSESGVHEEGDGVV